MDPQPNRKGKDSEGESVEQELAKQDLASITLETLLGIKNISMNISSTHLPGFYVTIVISEFQSRDWPIPFREK